MNDNGHLGSCVTSHMPHKVCRWIPLLGECDRQRIFGRFFSNVGTETNTKLWLVNFALLRFKFLFAKHENSCHTKLSEAVKKDLPSHGGTTPCWWNGKSTICQVIRCKRKFWNTVQCTIWAIAWFLEEEWILSILTSNNHIISFTFVIFQGQTNWPKNLDDFTEHKHVKKDYLNFIWILSRTNFSRLLPCGVSWHTSLLYWPLDGDCFEKHHN